MRWFLLAMLTLSSIVFTGCEKGSLGVKEGGIIGYTLDYNTNRPLSDVIISISHDTAGITQKGLSTADGSYSIGDLRQGAWTLRAEKYGYKVIISSDSTSQDPQLHATIVNGETTQAPTFRLMKTSVTVKGTLTGYPVDAITGSPLRNFTVTQLDPSKYKTFETAVDFRDNGWSGLEGGMHQYKITCDNYHAYTTPLVTAADAVTISASPYDLGVIKMSPETVSISGTLRNLPGYVLAITQFPGVIWAEAAGRVVATGSNTPFQGSVIYKLDGIPASIGNVSVKAKIRGYDLLTISSSVSVSSQLPTGIIAGVDCDFSNVEPIKRDLRVIVQGTMKDNDKPSSFTPGDRARVYIRQGGVDIVPYVDVVSVNYMAEAYFTGVTTGYDLDIYVINLDKGYYFGKEEKQNITEDGNTIFTIKVQLTSS